MRLILNGENFETSNSRTVQALLDELKIVSGRVAVEVNLEIVKKTDYETYMLSEGDKVEIVNFVGGGSKKNIKTKSYKSRHSIFAHSRSSA